MALFNLKGYRGDAEILGSLREVEFSSGTFTIHGMSLFEANRLLSVLATGKLQGIQPSDGGETDAAKAILQQGDVVTNPQKGSAPVEEPESLVEAAQAKPATKTPPKAVQEPEQGAVSAQRKRPGRPSAAAQEAPEQPASEAPAAQEEDTPKRAVPAARRVNGGGGGENAALIAELQDQRKLRRVLEIMIERGLTTQDSLLAKCMEIRSSVPVLERCADIDNRVRSIAASVGITE